MALENRLTSAFLLFAIAVSRSGGTTITNCQCGLPNENFGTRIVGGSLTTPHEFPWVAAIMDMNYAVFCGGSIITNRHILSAGHCAYHDPSQAPLKKFIAVGMHDSEVFDGTLYEIQKIFMHPDWLVYERYDAQDMAIYQTIITIRFSDWVRPICLPNSNKDYDEVKAQVAGWGHTKKGAKGSRFLLEAKIKVLQQETCQNNQHIGPMFVPNSMMCAFAPKKDACQGDSGGPLFTQTSASPIRYEQIGIVSFGIGCGDDYPAVYTRITTSMQWIRKVTQIADTCKDPELHNGV